jgi:diguanylate cyclase (GGDEF)-like protein
MPDYPGLTTEALARFPQINPYPVMALGAEGRVLYANAGAQPLLAGWGCGLGDPLPAAWGQAMEEVLAEGEAVEFHAPVADRLYNFRLVPETANGCVHLYATDDTEAHEARSRLRRLAYFDPLTGLANRMRLSQHLETGLGPTDTPFALLYLGLDRFKTIVSGMGHDQGDRVLEAVADRLVKLFPGVMVARVQGDEFAVAVPGVDSAESARSQVERIRAAFASPVCASRAPFPVSLSAGIALGRVAISGEALLRDAHSAMARAKSVSPGCERVFDDSLRSEYRRRLQLETDLGAMLDSGDQLVVHFQPIVALGGRMAVAAGFEALVRWDHPELGWLGPGDFVPLAEDAGLVGRLGRRVLEQAAAQAAAWNRAAADPVIISVNLAPQEVVEAGVAAQVADVLGEAGCEPQWIRFELTESALGGDPEWTRGNLQALRDLGCTLSIDDFGTGYSSLSHLHHFPFDSLKVDRSFVTDAPYHAHSRELVRAILAMSRSLGLTVVAEGVETDEQLDTVRELGADYVQGFRFAPGLAPEAAADWL